MDIVLGPLVQRGIAGECGGPQSTVAELKVGGQVGVAPAEVGVVPAEVKMGLDLWLCQTLCPQTLSSTEQRRKWKEDSYLTM